MKNIGFVLYKKGTEPGTLIAQGHHLDFGRETGKATGGPTKGFEGRYTISYFDEKGNNTASRELNIQRKGNYYELSFLNKGEISAIGIGIEVKEGLAAGWRDI